MSKSLPFFNLQDDKLQYVNTLQPKYSSIDLTEVELPETEANSMTHNDMERENENNNMLLDVRIYKYLGNIILRFVHLLGTEFGLSLQNNVFIHFVVPTFKMLQHFPFDFPLSLIQFGPPRLVCVLFFFLVVLFFTSHENLLHLRDINVLRNFRHEIMFSVFP